MIARLSIDPQIGITISQKVRLVHICGIGKARIGEALHQVVAARDDDT